MGVAIAEEKNAADNKDKDPMKYILAVGEDVVVDCCYA